MKRQIEEGSLVQHMDGRQGRVIEAGATLGALPAVKVAWFSGGIETVALGYIWTTNMEENWHERPGT